MPLALPLEKYSLSDKQAVINFGIKSGLKLIFFTGASGGHIMPALALRRKFPDASIIAVKTPASVDTLENAENVHYISPISFKKFRFGALREMFSLFVFACRLSPDKIVCFGSYLNFLGLLCARLSRCELVFFEPNASAGKGSLMLKRFADRIFTVFPSAAKELNGCARAVKFPVISAMRSKEKILQEVGFDFDKPVLLVIGGSQGSRFINAVVTAVIDKLSFAQIVHITGPKDFEKIQNQYQRHRGKHIVLPFCSTMPIFYSIASAAISRAGAGTLAELSYYKIPSVLIPYPGAGGHQKFNASQFASSAAAVVIKEEDINKENFPAVIENVLFRDFWKIRENVAKIEIADDGTDFAEKLSEVRHGHARGISA
ncbi:MAG: hypothetical protein COT16_00720 [Elusimicrobia bacterium CG08_land_8_20_14_0_20_44_26]|nr:MAG: hypothetical protein COT16_00720 [Elusimicrobia bacterium CG08_land_8_20_14_0_20_44_26]